MHVSREPPKYDTYCNPPVIIPGHGNFSLMGDSEVPSQKLHDFFFFYVQYDGNGALEQPITYSNNLNLKKYISIKHFLWNTLNNRKD